eukprot:TRINITY_DN947_c0_g3_i3.p1 TRINITY_DN947_c0_g3~~TRINITY_DN947_c0_g3_i3.p1  ORF type:complete len:150 (+),score=7.15 TRINITY_DN947_c0_g3_i3:110-559(+)
MKSRYTSNQGYNQPSTTSDYQTTRVTDVPNWAKSQTKQSPRSTSPSRRLHDLNFGDPFSRERATYSQSPAKPAVKPIETPAERSSSFSKLKSYNQPDEFSQIPQHRPHKELRDDDYGGKDDMMCGLRCMSRRKAKIVRGEPEDEGCKLI